MACERYAAIGLELGAAAAAHKKNKSGRQTQKKETKESRHRHGYQSRETLNTGARWGGGPCAGPSSIAGEGVLPLRTATGMRKDR
jgi:hypothetical protein